MKRTGPEDAWVAGGLVQPLRAVARQAPPANTHSHPSPRHPVTPSPRHPVTPNKAFR